MENKFINFIKIMIYHPRSALFIVMTSTIYVIHLHSYKSITVFIYLKAFFTFPGACS